MIDTDGPRPWLPPSDLDPDDVAPPKALPVPARVQAEAEARVAACTAALVEALDAYNAVQPDPVERCYVTQQAFLAVEEVRAERLQVAVAAGIGPAELGRKLGVRPTVIVMAHAPRPR